MQTICLKLTGKCFGIVELHFFKTNCYCFRSTENGWVRPLLSPMHHFQLHPGAKVLHYAIELFEGMKAYRGVDGRIRLFRPEMNMDRMRRTAARASLPDFDPEELIKIISNLIQIDQEWVPYSTTGSLYVRPTLIGTDSTLGVAHSNEAKLFVLTGPAGAYYPTGKLFRLFFKN